MKVLILCKDYPPSNRIGGKRPAAWHKYLPEFGIETEVVTSTPSPTIEPSVHRVDFGIEALENLALPGWKKIKRKARSFFELWLPFLFPFTSRYWPLYQEADNLLKSGNIQCIIATGEPFVLFAFAKKLSEKHKIPWIADYRDNWTNENSAVFNSTWMLAVSRRLRFVEKRLLKCAALVTTVGDYTADKIKDIYRNTNIKIIENGHSIPKDFQPVLPPRDRLVISYIGRLYDHRNPSMFLEAVKDWKTINPTHSLEIRFLGLQSFPDQWDDVIQKSDGIRDSVVATPLLPYGEMLEYASASHAFLLLAHPDFPTSNGKVFDYLGLQRNIILTLDDNGIFRRIIEKEKCGYIASTKAEIHRILDHLYSKLNTPELFIVRTNKEVYSRRYGVQKLAEYVKEICAAS